MEEEEGRPPELYASRVTLKVPSELFGLILLPASHEPFILEALLISREGYDSTCPEIERMKASAAAGSPLKAELLDYKLVLTLMGRMAFWNAPFGITNDRSAECAVRLEESVVVRLATGVELKSENFRRAPSSYLSTYIDFQEFRTCFPDAPINCKYIDRSNCVPCELTQDKNDCIPSIEK